MSDVEDWDWEALGLKDDNTFDGTFDAPEDERLLRDRFYTRDNTLRVAEARRALQHKLYNAGMTVRKMGREDLTEVSRLVRSLRPDDMGVVLQDSRQRITHVCVYRRLSPSGTIAVQGIVCSSSPHTVPFLAEVRLQWPVDAVLRLPEQSHCTHDPSILLDDPSTLFERSLSFADRGRYVNDMR